jgi:hypothetical protein
LPEAIGGDNHLLKHISNNVKEVSMREVQRVALAKASVFA